MRPSRHPVIRIAVVAAAVMLAGCGGAPGAPAEDAEDAAWMPPALAADGGELPEGREVIQRLVDLWTDQVAIRKPGADIQIWVEKGDPFPAKLAIVFTEDDGMPGYTARFDSWSTTLPDDPTLFQFAPPPGAERIDVVKVIQP